MRTEAVKIKTNGRTAEIMLNGLKIETLVRDYRLSQEANGFPVLELELLAPGMEYEGATVVEIPAELRAVLIALGWAAPA